jgi:hypothetical protein
MVSPADDSDDAADAPAAARAAEPEHAHGPGADRPRDPRDRDGDGLPDTLRQRLEALVPEIVKRTFAAGMGAVFSTEEGIRKLAKDNLPAAAGFVADKADNAKDKVLEVIARETREFLSNMNLTDEIAKILTTLSFEIKTEIRFIPNSERYGGVEPEVKAGVRLKRADRPDTAPERSERTERGERGERGERDRDDDHDDRGGLVARVGRRLLRRDTERIDQDRDRDRDAGDDPLDRE